MQRVFLYVSVKVFQFYAHVFFFILRMECSRIITHGFKFNYDTNTQTIFVALLKNMNTCQLLYFES